MRNLQRAGTLSRNPAWRLLRARGGGGPGGSPPADRRHLAIERTAVDVARLLRYEQAVAVLDAALHVGADPGLLDGIVCSSAGRKGVRTARSALLFADGRSENADESISRVRMAEVGLPMPVLQFLVFNRYGVWVARSDFCWTDKGVVGEFDGRVKYDGTRSEATDAVMAEKRREQAIRDAGWWVVRWDWDDLRDRSAFRRGILQAFDPAPR